MSAKSYEAWAAFDVERELERVDERAQREEQRRVIEQQQRAKQRVEDAVSTNAEQSAQVLAAHAAVAALKAKAKAKNKARVQNDAHTVALAADTASNSFSGSIGNGTTPGSNQTEAAQSDESAAARLQRHSELFAKKHELIKCIMESRREGDTALQRACEPTAASAATETQCALAAFERALAAAQSLEVMVPDVLAVEKEQRVLRDVQTSQSEVSAQSSKDSTAVSNHRHEHNHSCSGEHGKCSHTEMHASERKVITPPALPQVDDLAAILSMFFKDVYMGIGACHAQQSRLAAASEAFKQVLLRDDTHVAAWLERGRVFERMGAGLLAMLHFSRATQLDAKSEDANECLERVKETLLSDLDDTLDSTAVARKIESLTQSSPPGTLLSVLESIYLLFLEANVLMLEGFFQYAIPKYEVVLGCADACEQMRALHTESSSNVARAVCESLAQIRVSCRLNIASGYYEMHKCHSKGVEHCESVLAVSANGDSDFAAANHAVQAACHFRIGQLLRAAHMYERAMEHLIVARQLVAAERSKREPSSQEQQQQRDERLAKVEKEIDRCAFERSQHDLPHIRSLLAEAHLSGTRK